MLIDGLSSLIEKSYKKCINHDSIGYYRAIK